jgi:hypothetical protein
MVRNSDRSSLLIRATALVGSIAFAGALAGQSPSWFPLEVGNTWVYRSVRTNIRAVDSGPRVINVHGKETIDGRDYFDVAYFGREVLLRAEPADGSIAVFDRAANADLLWASLSRPVGSTYPAAIGPCSSTAEIAARDASATTPVGEFAGVVQVNYEASCADAGLTRQLYAPEIGLIQNEETSFAGPIVLELTYYRVGDRSASGPEAAFTLAIDGVRYPAGGLLNARLTLRNTTEAPIPLHFPSGQSYDLKIYDAAGAVVYQWSKGRAFTMIIRDEDFGPGERSYALTAPLDGLAPGHYTVEAYITTEPVVYRATGQFDVVGTVASAKKVADGVVKIGGGDVDLK